MPFAPWKTRPGRLAARLASISAARSVVWLVATAWLCFGLTAISEKARAADGDVKAGAVVARTWCANCHVIAPEQKVARFEAPSFRSLANDPARTKEGLRTFLFAPHPPMPDLELSRRQIDDVIAYIESLQTR